MPWDWGHFILWLAERPVVATGFGTYLDEQGFEQVKKSQLGSEDQLVSWMDRRRLGYMVGGAATFLGRVSAHDESPPLVSDENRRAVPNAVFLRDRPVGTMLIGGSGVPSQGVGHLSRLRPVFASTATVPEAAAALPALWVYERVEPGLLQGEAPPGTPVVAGIMLDVRQSPWPWEAGTWTDSEGRWSVAVPIVPGSVTGGIRADDAYTVWVGEAEPVAMQPTFPSQSPR